MSTEARPTTDAGVYAQDAMRSVETIARELEELAGRLRAQVSGFNNPNLSAVGLAADIVSDYTQGVGSRGTRLWTLVHAAGLVDQARAREVKP